MPVYAYRPTEGLDVAHSFVEYLKQTHYRLWVEVKDSAAALRCQSEYAAASGGAELPEAAIVEYPKRTNPREWRLEFQFSENVQYPFPVIVAGTLGKRPTGTDSPAALLSKNGRAIVQYADIVLGLVAAGLRAHDELRQRPPMI